MGAGCIRLGFLPSFSGKGTGQGSEADLSFLGLSSTGGVWGAVLMGLRTLRVCQAMPQPHFSQEQTREHLEGRGRCSRVFISLGQVRAAAAAARMGRAATKAQQGEKG